MGSYEELELFRILAVLGFAAVGLGIGGWVLTTWMRMKHGYPLGDANDAVYPLASGETIERLRLLTQENAQLRAEMGAIKDRLATVERIVTDGAFRLDREIEGLRGTAN